MKDKRLSTLDVAGSIPVSRFIYKEVMPMRNKEMKAALEALRVALRLQRISNGFRWISLPSGLDCFFCTPR
jgi:hypothetical protein